MDMLPKDKIPFMHWGIINSFNFSPEKIIPYRQMDKLLGNLTDFKNHFYAPISYISPVRDSKPFEIGNSKYKPEVFSEIINGSEFDIVVAKDDKALNENVFSDTPIKQALSDFRALTVINRFPAGVRVIDSSLLPKFAGYNNMICLVSFSTRYPDELKYLDKAKELNYVEKPYHQIVSRTPAEDLEHLLSSMNSSIKASLKESEQRGIKEILIYPFFNIGKLAGGSLQRLHSQTYLDLNQAGHGPKFESMLKTFKESCPLCFSSHEERLVYENDSFNVWVSKSPIRNYHLRFAPKEHKYSITSLDKKGIEDMADVLKKSNTALSMLGVNENRNILFNVLPFGYDRRKFHFYGDILPYEPVGSIELIDLIRVASVNPFRIADEIKKQMESATSFNDYQY